MAVTKNKPVVRGRNWAFLMYADKVDALGGYDHIRQMFLALHVPALISPCHNNDVYDEDSINQWVERNRDESGKIPEDKLASKPIAGELEMPHYHFMLCFKGNKTYNTVLESLKPLGIKYVMRVEDKAAYMRYCCHLDQPDKAQYNVEECCTLNGLDRSPLYELASIDKTSCLTEICTYIRTERCVYFCDLVDGIIASNDLTTLGVLIEKCNFVNMYQSSYGQKLGINMVE